MTNTAQDFTWALEHRLKAAIGRYRVPGASIAVFAEDALTEAAAGVLNLETGVEATVQSVFHIASVTKPITTTLAMQFVDEGRLDLDAPVRRYLPDFRVASPEASERITVRQLLCHSSGIDGDFFIETTRGEDRVAKLVEAGHILPQLHEPGRGFSYCNHGFGVVGRILEVLDGSDFDTIWRKRLSEKINAPTLLTLTSDALRYRVAVGHMGGKDGPVLPRQIFLGTSNGPAGATPMARARDLVTFGLMHLNEGVTREGTRVLSKASALTMREPQNALPALQIAHHFGLGFMLFDWGGHGLFGHDGLSIFQRSYLRILPEKRMVFALLTNGGDGGGLFRDLASEFFSLGGVAMTPVLKAEASARVDPERYVGVYERRSTRVTVAARDSKLTMTTVWHDDWARELYGTMGPFPLEPIDADKFLCMVPGMVEPQLVNFMHADASGTFQSVHTGLRINHRT